MLRVQEGSLNWYFVLGRVNVIETGATGNAEIQRVFFFVALFTNGPRLFLGGFLSFKLIKWLKCPDFCVACSSWQKQENNPDLPIVAPQVLMTGLSVSSGVCGHRDRSETERHWIIGAQQGLLWAAWPHPWTHCLCYFREVVCGGVGRRRKRLDLNFLFTSLDDLAPTRKSSSNLLI